MNRFDRRFQEIPTPKLLKNGVPEKDRKREREADRQERLKVQLSDQRLIEDELFVCALPLPD